MCNIRSSKRIRILEKTVRVDKCLSNLIKIINSSPYKTLACCCGHGRYRMTVVIKDDYDRIFELMSDKDIPRKKRFYKKDKEGFYYIPELVFQDKQ